MHAENQSVSKLRSFLGLVRRGAALVAISALTALAILELIVTFGPEQPVPPAWAQAPVAMPFDLRSATVDSRQIRAGGPPKDGIPAHTNPSFLKAAEANYLRPEDRVIGITLHEQSRAYPLAILNYHEIVNDTIGKTPVAVTYCPLCDSAVVFDRRTPLGVREFGVSGLLYNSNVLMYDRRGKPESLWSQVQTKGISGPGAKQQLSVLPCELTSWESWKARHPETGVMSTNTGHQRDYSRSPYAGYFAVQELMFPVTPLNPRYPNKERVLGVWAGTQFRAYPESAFPADQSRITDTIGDKKITVNFDRTRRTFRVEQADEGVLWLYSFWFAWYSLHPETSVYGDADTSTKIR